MNLIFIYGPPAAGKLSVSKELKKLTGYKIFHNHLTLDLASHLFEFGSPGFFKLVDRLRLYLIEEAAKRDTGLIFTFCYVHPDDGRFVKKVIQGVKKHGGHVRFVQLYCDQSVLLKRVKHASRESFNKLRSKRKLSKSLETYDFFSPIPSVENLRIDNTKISAREAAKMIANHYKLNILPS